MKFKQSIILIIFTVQIIFSSSAGKLDKAFEALRIHDYFKAKELFNKSLKKRPSPSSFGLATIFFRNDNPFHSLDSAYKYVGISEKNYSSLKEKDKEKYKKYGFEYLTVLELQRKISSGFFIRALEENSVESYNIFIENHPWSTELFTAIHKRDSLAFEAAGKLNTSTAYNDFIINYPESKLINEAREAFYREQYREFTLSNTLASYIEFIKKCPESPYLSNAENRVFEIVTSPNTVNACYLFIKNYPSNRYVSEAWRKLYQLYMTDFSVERIEQFRTAYPDYPYAADLETDLLYSRRELLPFKIGTLFGFIDYDGNSVIEPEYENLGFFREGMAVAVKNGKYGYIDKGNRVLIDFKFDNALDFEQGRAIVELNGLMGMIDRAGNLVFPCEYKDLGTLSEGMIYALRDSLYGYFDKNGLRRINDRFQEAYSFQNGIAKVQIGENQAYIDIHGAYVVPPGYSDISFYNDSLLIFEEDGLYGLMKRNCTVVQGANFEEIGILKEGRSLFVQNDLIGYLDNNGQIIIQAIYELYPNHLIKGTFNENVAVVFVKGKYALIDRNGKNITQPVYTNLGEPGKLMAFTKGKGWGFIDGSGKEMIKPEFEFAESFKNGFAIVEKLTLSGVIDSKNKIIVPQSFVSISNFGEKYFLVSSGSKFGVFDTNGSMIVPMDYQQIRLMDKDFMILTNSEEIHYFYIQGNKIVKYKESSE